ncbi:MAG TPA: hypothetical protein VF756_06310 [Thermoanaerobaculia bacterium]
MQDVQEAKPRRWVRLVISLLVGLATAYIDYCSRQKAGGLISPQAAEWASRGIISAIAAALLGEVWAFKTSLDELAKKVTLNGDKSENLTAGLMSQLQEIKDSTFGDERIIFARQQLSRESRVVSVLGIEAVDPVPEALTYAPQCGAFKRWRRSVSLLRFDRIQDLLFSKSYLDHFFSLAQRATETYRILVINDKPRSADAVRSFLQISASFRVKTYVYRKSEYYAMLEFIAGLVPDREDAVRVREILSGNPELNLMTNRDVEFQGWEPGTLVTPANDYVLRYLSSAGGRREIVTRAPGQRGLEVGTIPSCQVAWVLRIMDCALRGDSRLGLSAFERTIAENGPAPENYWSRYNLEMVRPKKECA